MSTNTAVNTGEGSTVVTLDSAAPSTPVVEEEVIEVGDRTTVRPRVQWATDTVDNEEMGKKSSKCCCIYKKPKKWDDSSSSEDSDCETGHCRGHVEKKHKHHDHGDDNGAGPSSSAS
uniref:E3 ubiquitin-protein ligase PPP1R11 n=1 Tax=Panagrellus redivivus TaxID=6233 RepID=A0A7E4ZRP9_PANRE